jgi:hypothetical protein
MVDSLVRHLALLVIKRDLKMKEVTYSYQLLTPLSKLQKDMENPESFF